MNDVANSSMNNNVNGKPDPYGIRTKKVSCDYEWKKKMLFIEDK